jgi:hypothetical protein
MKTEVIECCSCESTNRREFISEMGIRSGGLKNINQPVVWVFPRLRVCLNCGNAEFTVPETELRALGQNDIAAATG